MISTYTTNFIGSDGVDVGSKLLTREYFNDVYLNIANQYITPELWVWGNGGYGKLGDNTAIGKSSPVTTFAGGANWKQVSAGINHIAAIKTDGTLWIWGGGSSGQLGNAVTTARSTPVTTFAGGTNWRQVSSGGSHTAAIKNDGTLWVWGNNAYGRLGTNDVVQKLTPVTTFAGGNNWKQVAAGFSQTLAIKTDGTLWVWGSSTNGRLGTNDEIQRLTPVTTFTGGNNWKQISSGSSHVAAIKTDGTLWNWGSGANGRLGTNDIIDRSTPVTTFAGGNDWKQVSNGYFHTVAIKTDGTLWGWGFTGYGQLGTRTISSRSTPVTTFAGGNNWKQVSAGSESTSAIKTDGTLWVWGRGNQGQLGINDNNNKLTPITTFFGGNNWKQASTGISMVAIRSYDEY